MGSNPVNMQIVALSQFRAKLRAGLACTLTTSSSERHGNASSCLAVVPSSDDRWQGGGSIVELEDVGSNGMPKLLAMLPASEFSVECV